MFLELHQPEIPSRTQALKNMKIGSLSPLSRGARGLTEVFLELHQPEIPSRTQALKNMKICPLSPSPPWGEGWGEGWIHLAPQRQNL